MTTLAPQLMRQFSDEWEKLFKSAVGSGIVGDTAHRLRGGYHISIEDQSSDNYSVVRSDDKAPPGTWPRDLASACDMSVSLSDMKLIDSRVEKVFGDHSDPRRLYINAVNCWDGIGSPGRFDMVTNDVSTASDDHKWHVHWEIRRRYVNDPKAYSASLSILSGEPKGNWGATVPPVYVPKLRRPWPRYMKPGQYFGLISGPPASRGGYNSFEKVDIRAIQRRLIELRVVPGITNPASAWADGVFEWPTKNAVARWQHEKYSTTTSRYGEVWQDDWNHLFTY